MTSNQTTSPVEEPLQALTLAQPLSLWETARVNTDLNVDPGLAGPSSTAPTTPLHGSATQPSTLSRQTASPSFSSTAQPSAKADQSRPAPTSQTSRSREGRERKRSRLSIDATPLDSVDYWIDFDKDENLAPESLEPLSSSMERKGKAPMTPQPTNTAAPTSTLAFKGEDDADDSALDKTLSDEDEEGLSSINLTDHLSKIDSVAPQEAPPREGLYSTPLSWERPQPGLRMDSLIGLNSRAWNEDIRRDLIAIAMNPGPSMGGLGSNLSSTDLSGPNPVMTTTASGTGLGSSSTSQGPKPAPVSPPQPSAAKPRPPPAPNPPDKQRRSTSEKGKDRPKGDRTAHNDIERKYRTNLKDKIAELRDAVPALRAIPGNGGEDDGMQPSRAPKVSKGTVLTKATEYIHYLERRNKQIMQEHRELSRRLAAFEQLLGATAWSSYPMPNYSRTIFDPRGFC
ncbi:hypothetical protein VTK56DRAFT_8462 [Thermocarpiscus australiensis]